MHLHTALRRLVVNANARVGNPDADVGWSVSTEMGYCIPLYPVTEVNVVYRGILAARINPEGLAQIISRRLRAQSNVPEGGLRVGRAAGVGGNAGAAC